MFFERIKTSAVSLACLATLALAGCGTSVVSRNVDDNGHAEEVVFPDAGTQAWLKEGTFPRVDDLRRIQPGISKDQLYALVGRPHFREGLGSVREWDYIFHFPGAGEGKPATCQYKVIFDKDMRGQTFHWLPASCAAHVDAPATAS